MGSRIQHIAFIVFALLFVAIIAVINTGILSTTVQTSNSSTMELYNNTKISGDTVAAAAKNPNSLANTSMTIYVVTKAKNALPTKAGEGLYGNDNKYQAKSGDPNYINSSAQFDSYLLQNDNGVTSGVLFIQEGCSYKVDSFNADGLTVVK